MSNEILDHNKAIVLNPLHKRNDEPPTYIKPNTEVTIKIESREQELAILAAYDYGLDCLGKEGKRQIERLIADLKFAISP